MSGRSFQTRSESHPCASVVPFEAALRGRYFAQYGRVLDAAVLADSETKRSRGFGFVDFAGEIPAAVLEQEHVIEQRRCGVRKSPRRAATQSVVIAGLVTLYSGAVWILVVFQKVLGRLVLKDLGYCYRWWVSADHYLRGGSYARVLQSSELGRRYEYTPQGMA